MGSTAAMFLQGAETYQTISQQRRQAAAMRAQGRYEAAAYDRNAQLAEQQATDAIARGDVAAATRRTQGRLEQGSARAAMAGGGVQVGVGSAGDVEENIARLGALDIATIRNNAAREAWGYRVQGADYTERGRLTRIGAEQAARGLDADQVTTLLTGATKTYGIYRSRRDGGGRRPATAAAASTPAAPIYPDD